MSVPKKLRKPGPDRGGAAAAARENTGLRTYRVQGETKSPARAVLEERLATRKGMSKHYVGFLHYLLLGCA
jgi:hypothetical protein